MAKPVRLRQVTEAGRSGGTSGAPASASCRDASFGEEARVRTAPWMAFNATALPAPAAGSAPAFGPNRFLLGANLPWLRYGLDIGSSAATPEGGLHAHAESQEALDVALARLSRDGVEHVRVFLLCDGRAGIRFEADGTPAGLDDAVFADVDVLLAAAERHRLGLFLVLFDAGLVAPPSVVDGLRTGGHADVLSEPAKQEALLARVVEPLLRRYGSHPAIDAWDIFDEPECATLGMACPHPVRARSSRLRAAMVAALRAVGFHPRCPPAPTLVLSSAMRSFLGAAVQAVHQHTRALATVGLASTANLGLVGNLGLDFYQAHWWQAYGDAALRRAAADFRLSRPLVLGAFPAAMQSKSVKTVLDTARSAGYGGALVWSLRAVDARSGQDGQLGQWARNHAAHLYRRPPRVEIAPQPIPAVAVEPVAPEAASSDGDDDEVRAPRGESEADVAKLAAAPA